MSRATTKNRAGKNRASGHTAVMADKASAAAIEAEADPVRRLHLALNYFPTPPWATRALLEHVIPDALGGRLPAGVSPSASKTCWEPACGEGHMVRVLEERFGAVFASDVHDYGVGKVGSFVGQGLDVLPPPAVLPDWVITNPPFALAAEFVERSLQVATEGVAMLVRTTWLEGQDRYERLFRDSRPAIVAAFVERVPMTVGRWDPDADTATAYAWVVWRRVPMLPGQTKLRQPRHHWDHHGASLMWIPPGCRQRLTRPDDISRFAGAEPTGATLFDPRSAAASETNEVAA